MNQLKWKLNWQSTDEEHNLAVYTVTDKEPECPSLSKPGSWSVSALTTESHTWELSHNKEKEMEADKKGV